MKLSNIEVMIVCNQIVMSYVDIIISSWYNVTSQQNIIGLMNV